MVWFRAFKKARHSLTGSVSAAGSRPATCGADTGSQAVHKPCHFPQVLQIRVTLLLVSLVLVESIPHIHTLIGKAPGKLLSRLSQRKIDEQFACRPRQLLADIESVEVILDYPIVRGEAGEDLYGCYLKDYAPSNW